MEHMPPVEGAIPKAFPFGEGAERSEADEENKGLISAKFFPHPPTFVGPPSPLEKAYFFNRTHR